MRHRHLAALSLGLWFACTSVAQAVSTSIPPANQPVTGPASALEAYANAFRARSPDGVGAVLTADYVAHQLGDSLIGYTWGLSREGEMRAVRGMLEGVTRDGVVVVPPPDTVSLWADGVSQSQDPEHPDSTTYYRVLVVKRFEARLGHANGPALWVPPSTHVLHVVRGDAAVLAAGQSADPDRWYIRRWLNDVSGVRAALDRRQGGCGEQDPPAAPGVSPAAAAPAPPGVLAVRALMNPACARLQVTCDLPGSEPAKLEVYDVGGRLVNQRAIAVRSPGTLTVEAGAGAHLLPGVYWVRLGQAARHPSTRMVVVAR